MPPHYGEYMIFWDCLSHCLLRLPISDQIQIDHCITRQVLKLHLNRPIHKEVIEFWPLRSQNRPLCAALPASLPHSNILEGCEWRGRVGEGEGGARTPRKLLMRSAERRGVHSPTASSWRPRGVPVASLRRPRGVPMRLGTGNAVAAAAAACGHPTPPPH